MPNFNGSKAFVGDENMVRNSVKKSINKLIDEIGDLVSRIDKIFNDFLRYPYLSKKMSPTELPHISKIIHDRIINNTTRVIANLDGLKSSLDKQQKDIDYYITTLAETMEKLEKDVVSMPKTDRTEEVTAIFGKLDKLFSELDSLLGELKKKA